MRGAGYFIRRDATDLSIANSRSSLATRSTIGSGLCARIHSRNRLNVFGHLDVNRIILQYLTFLFTNLFDQLLLLLQRLRGSKFLEQQSTGIKNLLCTGSEGQVLVAGIPQIKPTFLDIAPSGIPSNIIPHSKGVKCGLIRSNSPFSYSNHRPAKPKIPKPLVYAQVSPLGTSFATP